MVMVNGRCLPKDPWHMKYYWDLRKVAWQCARCHNCKWIDSWEVKSARFARVCPSSAYYVFDGYSCQGRMDATVALLDSEWKYEDSPDLLGVFFKCNMCGGCDANCKRVQDMEPLRVIQEMRCKLVSDGQLLPAHVPVIEGLRKHDNMLQKPRGERGRWAEGLKVRDFAVARASVVFQAGCQYSYDRTLWPVARSAVGLLLDAGVDLAIMGKDEVCCGGRAYEMGYQGELRKYAESNIETWSGVKTVVTPCADCYYTLKRLYAGFGAGFEVLHVVEYLDRLVKEGRLKLRKPVPLTVTYHDPCHLGRRDHVYVPGEPVMGVYDRPRDLLRSIPGVQLVEMERIKENAWCCGAGGGVREAYPDFNAFAAGERVEEARATRAQALVTACPWCERNFTDALDGTGALKVYDVVELVARSV